MVSKYILFFGLMILLGGTSVESYASLLICQKGKCNYANEDITLKPWLHQLYCFFKTPDARIDFCEADPKSRKCQATGLNWQATSSVASVTFSIPVARTLPYKKTLLMDYLVSANAFLPSCGFSPTTFEEEETNKTLRMVSNTFECQLSDVAKVSLQNTFFIDYIDFDNAVIGAQYIVRTHGEIKGQSTGYTLMKFRDGKTLLPLVPQPYYGEMPAAPTPDEAKALAKAMIQTTSEPKEPFDEFVDGVKDWWEQLKDSFNLDKPKRRVPNEEPHWWQKFSDNFMKVFYLEPLD